MLETPLAPAWIQIDSGAIVHNFLKLKERLKKNTRILAVVKADAYGCGAEEMARVLLDAGADMLGVTSLTEALELRRTGIAAPILVFAPLLPESMQAALENDLTVSVGRPGELKELAIAAKNIQKKATIHLKIETGMGRTGFFPEELSDVTSILKGESLLELEGVYTHFARAGNAGYTKKQFTKFINCVEYLERLGVNVPFKHCANSTAAVSYPEMQLDMVRVGTLLYGQKPASLQKNLDIKDPWRVYARILTVRKIPKGHYIGYGGEFRTKRESTIAVIPIGFADGYATVPEARPKDFIDLLKKVAKDVLAYLGKGPQAAAVSIRNKRVPVVGRIGMQLSMIDVTEIPNVRVGEEVKLAMRRITASSKLPRVYVKDGKPYKVRYLEGKLEDMAALSK
ncbi:MAG: alanine racemase [Clostridia bacterium]|jgi:alanine racemase|nr:alanine racemase [Clostridiales bacterium]MDK2985548.1 alanine racemase [Clostridia bacterium]